MKEVENLAIEVVKDLKDIQRQLKVHLHRRFKNREITAPQGMLIFMLSHHEQLKISDVSEKMGLSNSTVSGIIDRLEAMNYVERIRSKEDRRVVYVRVTDTVREELKMHDDTLDSLLAEALRSMTMEEAAQIATSLRLLSEAIRNNNEGENNLC